MDVFIYTNDSLGCDRNEVEDALEEALEGMGEVTGGGSGQRGSNWDLEIRENHSEEEVLHLIRTVLKNLKCPQSTSIVISGRRYPLYPAATK